MDVRVFNILNSQEFIQFKAIRPTASTLFGKKCKIQLDLANLQTQLVSELEWFSESSSLPYRIIP